MLSNFKVTVTQLARVTEKYISAMELEERCK